MDLSTGTIPYQNVVFSGPVDPSSPIPLANLQNKTIVLTGGSSGLGAACAKEWARHGANVIIGDVSERAGTELVAQMRTSSKNANHHFIPLDVTDWQSQAAFFKRAASLSPHGGIDCVVANAGICDAPETAQFEDPPNYQAMNNPAEPRMKTLEVNLTGVMHTTHLALSYLSRNPGSEKCSTTPSVGPRDRHLILVSSIAGIAALPSQSIYCASKHGVVGLFRSLRITAPIATGVRVNMLNPYFADTPILGAAGSLVMAGGAMAKVEDVVDAATRLAAGKAIIGRALVIGARGYADQLRAVGLEPPEGFDKGQAVWDVFGHDMAQTELFTRRIIGVINLATMARGWMGILADIVTKVTAPLRNTFG